MSHFCLLVVGEIEKQLEPFSAIDDRYIKFIDITEEFETKYVGFPENREKYKTLDEYFKLNGYVKNEEGRYGYYANENSKWDWYVIGGRWKGELIVKKEAIMKGVFYAPVRVNIALKKDIDIEAMEKPMRESAAKIWDDWHINGIKEKYHIFAKKSISMGRMPEELTYWINEHVGFWNIDESLKKINTMRRTDYIYKNSLWHTHALLWKNEWYDEGTMGWFGINIEEKEEWPENFKNLWKQIPDDELITVVDCHV